MKKLFSWFRRKECKNPPPQVSMEIPDFVHAALVGIISGIQRAQQEHVDGNSAFDPLICPAWGPPLSDLGGSAKGHADKIHEIEFDLAVTITSTSSSKAGGKAGSRVIGVYTGELECSAESAGTHSSISRMKFKVPVRYPLAKLGKPDWNPQEK